MSETVRLQIKIDDNGSFKNVEVNAEDLSRVIKEVKDNVDELSDNFVKSAAKLEILQNVTSMIGQIQGVVTDLTSAYVLCMVRFRRGKTDFLLSLHREHLI